MKQPRVSKWIAIAAILLQPAATAALAQGSEKSIPIESHIFGALRARAIGPAVMGGRIAAMDVVNANPRIIYVGAASGGLWKSTNGGTTFKPIFDEYTQSISAITIDQAHPDTVWVGTGEPWVRNSVSVGTGLYKTEDGGDTWQLIGLEDSERIGRIVIHPTNPDMVYVAALGRLWNDSEERGLYKTTDGGRTWERILYVDERTGCSDVALDPQEPDIVYATMWEFRREPHFFSSGGPGSGLHKSTDGGTTWQEVRDGLPEGNLGRIAIAIAPTRPSRIYATVEAEKSALYRSDDFGQHWEKVNTSRVVKDRPFYFSLLVPDPVDYNRIYKPSTGLSVSKDGGKSFTGLGGGVHPDYHAMWINPDNPDHILAGNDGGLYVSFDRGGSWRFLQNLPISQFYRVSCDTARPYNVYGGLQDNGSWTGPSRSAGGIRNSDWENLGGGDGFYVFVDPTDDDIVYWEYQGGNLFRKHRFTGDNKDIKPYPAENEPEYRFNWNTPIAFSPTNPHRMYIGSQFLHRSTDRGDSWQRISDDLTTNDPDKQRQEESGGLTVDNTTAENHCTIYSISESPLDEQVIWVGTDDGNVQVTKDGGKTWRNVIKNVKGVPKHTWCSSVEAGRHDRNTAYVTLDGHRTGDMTTYVFTTGDLGKSWRLITTDSLRGYAHVVREDPVRAGLLYLGTEFGLFISLDGGLNWAQFRENLPNVSVRDIVIHPRESDLVLATHGRGIYIIDDITPLRQITADVLAADVAMLESRPAEKRMFQWMQHFPGAGEFTGDNPDEVGKIIYCLKKRHMFGDLKVEVYDPDGNLIKTLPGGKRKGINVVNWYMRLEPPRVAPSPMLAWGALFGPMAPEGTYAVRLVKGSDRFEGQITLVPDPTSPHSAEDRAFQHETVMKLYGMQGRLAYISEAMTDARDQARDRADSLKKGGLKKDLLSFADDLDSLRSRLMVTERAEQGIPGVEKLREKVINLYQVVSSYGGRPTQSQLERLTILEGEIEQANSDFQGITGPRLEELNRELQSKNLTPITLLTREEFEKREQ
ncbi:MAG: glycosyl hydrolase [Candidatus Zixiibacteriota bacterium]